MANKSFKPDTWEVEELAAHLCDIDSEDRDEIENAFYERFGIDLEKFQDVVSLLCTTLSFGISPLTDTAFIGFSAKEKGKNIERWLIKKDISPGFIGGVIQWLGGDKIKKGSNGFSRTITSKGIPEFDITITPATGNKLTPLNDELCKALEHAKTVIEQWHGPEAWDIYQAKAPEMKKINDAIKKAKSKAK